jgi:hypothetical protein
LTWAPGFAGLEPYRGAKAQIKIDNTAIIHSVRLMGYPITYDPGEGDKDKEGIIK